MDANDKAGATTTRPYLIRALHEWCSDNGFTPYIAVQVDRLVQVPMEYVNKGEIVLNIGFEATSNLELGNEWVRFKARFAGVARDIVVPVDHVVAIYAKENGQGMAFPAPGAEDAAARGAAPVAPAVPAAAPGPRGLRLAPAPADEAGGADATDGDDGPDAPGPGGGRPALKRVK
ncbi:MAG: ClpXP protease specificity-enhancing factor [Pelomonas sp.]|nr:ClpXP protease specificity-enhancing factor [Roseateles sp.]